MKMSARSDVFWDFKRFMSTENVEICGQSKADLRKYYASQYTSYKQQISPDVSLPSFFSLMQTMFKLGIAHYQDGYLVIPTEPQPPKMKRNRRHRGKKSPQKVGDEGADSKQQSDQKGSDAEGSKKHVLKKNKLAVDQHMTYKSSLPRIVNEQAFKGSIFSLFIMIR